MSQQLTTKERKERLASELASLTRERSLGERRVTALGITLNPERLTISESERVSKRRVKQGARPEKGSIHPVKVKDATGKDQTWYVDKRGNLTVRNPGQTVRTTLIRVEPTSAVQTFPDGTVEPVTVEYHGTARRTSQHGLKVLQGKVEAHVYRSSGWSGMGKRKAK